MKRLILVLTLVFVFATACGGQPTKTSTPNPPTNTPVPSNTPQPPTNTPRPPTITPEPPPTDPPPTDPPTNSYRVTKSTDLYESAYIDAATIETLGVGSIVRPSQGNILICVELEELGTINVLCHVEYTVSGAKGWVLRKWIEEYP